MNTGYFDSYDLSLLLLGFRRIPYSNSNAMVSLLLLSPSVLTLQCHLFSSAPLPSPPILNLHFRVFLLLLSPHYLTYNAMGSLLLLSLPLPYLTLYPIRILRPLPTETRNSLCSRFHSPNLLLTLLFHLLS